MKNGVPERTIIDLAKRMGGKPVYVYHTAGMYSVYEVELDPEANNRTEGK